MNGTHGTSFSFDDIDKDRIEAVLVGTESISQFAYKATMEKVNRMETRDDQARKKLYQRDKKLIRRVVEDVMEDMHDGK